MADVRIADTAWLRSLGHVDAVKWSTRWGTGPCGPEQASCTVDVDPSTDSSLLRVGRQFVIEEGVPVFGGETAEPQRGFPWNLTAAGWATRARDFLAVDADGAPTTNTREAVTRAIAGGLPWANPEAFPDEAFGDAPVTPQTLDQVLNSWGTIAGLRWGTDVYGVAFTAADPTEPTLFLDASDLPIGVADDGLYTAVHATYVNSVDGGGAPDGYDYATAVDADAAGLYGTREYEMDLTPLGLLDGSTAAAHAQAQLDLLNVPQWLSRITTNASRLRTHGYHPAHLPMVAAGQMVRLYNVPNNLGGLRAELGLDIVLGEVEYDTTNPSEITIAPVGIAVRNLADAFAQAAQTTKAVAQVSPWLTTSVVTF